MNIAWSEQPLIWVCVQHHNLSHEKQLDWIAHIFLLDQFSLAYFIHMLCCFSSRLNFVVQKKLITCFNVYVDVCHLAFYFLCILLPLVLSFLFVCLCRPTLFSFQCHVIAIVTLACTLLSHHWSMPAGRSNPVSWSSQSRQMLYWSLRFLLVVSFPTYAHRCNTWLCWLPDYTDSAKLRQNMQFAMSAVSIKSLMEEWLDEYQCPV